MTPPHLDRPSANTEPTPPKMLYKKARAGLQMSLGLRGEGGEANLFISAKTLMRHGDVFPWVP